MSKLAEMQARFQQKQMAEKEEKLLRLYENQQQRAFDRVGRGSAGSNTSIGSTGGGKVRQMFDERRQKAGVDKSYPLEPLKTARSNGTAKGGSLDRQRNSSTRTVVKSTVQKSVTQVKNGKPVVNKREVVHSIYNNNNGDESYEEHRYDDDNYRSPSFDLIEMMNRNNIGDGLDNEQMPQIGFDDVDEPYVKGKLANVGGKLPSQTVTRTNASSKTNGVTPVAKRETKPSVRKTAVKPTNRTVTSPPSKTSSVTSSPVKATSKSISSTMKTAQEKVPNTSRPSAKQVPKQGPAATPRDDLAECKICHRKFAEDRLAVHESICIKAAQSKRKKYDATKHRLQGTDLEQYGRKIHKITKSPAKPTSKKDWRRTHEEFIAAIRSAKVMQQHLAKGGKLADLPPPPPSSNPDYVQCPHCGRRFNESAAERHIPKCANFAHNKPSAAAKGKTAVKR